VDDERSILITMSAILERHGYKVTAAGTVADAKQRLKTGKFDLVLSDLKMEGRDAGYEVLHAASQESYHPATLLVTASPPPAGEWQNNGAKAMLEKPMDLALLMKTIARLLAER